MGRSLRAPIWYGAKFHFIGKLMKADMRIYENTVFVKNLPWDAGFRPMGDSDFKGPNYQVRDAIFLNSPTVETWLFRPPSTVTT